jgi:hypothetical protein
MIRSSWIPGADPDPVAIPHNSLMFPSIDGALPKGASPSAPAGFLTNSLAPLAAASAPSSGSNHAGADAAESKPIAPAIARKPAAKGSSGNNRFARLV